jgi:hypothetical protein
VISKEERIARARRELDKLLSDWSDRHELPPLEELAILSEAQAAVARQWQTIEQEEGSNAD